MNSEHDRHDRLLVARYAVGDAYPSEQDGARDLVGNCDSCAALAADIRLISHKTTSLPAVSRPRDFRITAEQAERLRGSWFERFMRAFSAPGWSVVRPMAAASLAIGIVLVVVGTLPISLTGGTSSEVVSDQAHSSLPVGAPPVTQRAAAASAAVALPSAAASFGAVGPVLAPAPSGPAEVDSSATLDANGKTPAALPAASAGSALNGAGGAASAAPPKMASVAPSAADTTGQSYGARPSPAPAAISGPAIGRASVGSVNQPLFDRSLLVLIGMVVAFLALIALGFLYLARRRYSDPLVR